MSDPAFYRGRSLWLDGVASAGDLLDRAPLPGPLDVDVAIVGAGYTGLWTAYYLRRADPGLRVAVLEREVAGFGASSRNGGWCSAFMAMDRRSWRPRPGAGGDRPPAAMFGTVDEVGRVAEREGVDCHYVKGGALQVAASLVQLARLEAAGPARRQQGHGPDDQRLLGWRGGRAAGAGVGAPGRRLHPHCATVDPARLARGLAQVVERLGVPIYETTPVTRIRPGRADTARGPVRAEMVVRPPRATAPPCPDCAGACSRCTRSCWPPSRCQTPRGNGSAGRPVRPWPPAATSSPMPSGPATAGSPSAAAAPPTTSGPASGPPTTATTTSTPAWRPPWASPPPAAGARITHRWGGPLGIPRDWTASVGLDRATGLAWAGRLRRRRMRPRPTWPAAPWPT